MSKRKKHIRDIVVDGETYKWSAIVSDSFYKISTVKIWKDRKLIFEEEFVYGKTISPRLIKGMIDGLAKKRNIHKLIDKI